MFDNVTLTELLQIEGNLDLEWISHVLASQSLLGNRRTSGPEVTIIGCEPGSRSSVWKYRLKKGCCVLFFWGGGGGGSTQQPLAQDKQDKKDTWCRCIILVPISEA